MDLRDYDSRRYAIRYVHAVSAVLGALDQAPVSSIPLAVPYAEGLYKLMAYKDEYEVARLLLLDSAGEAVDRQFGEGTKITWKLHPPILRALGMRSKISLGPWSRPALVALRGMKGLRGTWADPFGATTMRRLERLLISAYEEMARQAVSAATADNEAGLRELLASPEIIRGYEFVKLANVRRWCDEVDRLAAAADLGSWGLNVVLRGLSRAGPVLLARSRIWPQFDDLPGCVTVRGGPGPALPRTRCGWPPG
jgi:indolepyruvate ferredoxin oxidoreductase